MFIDTHAHIYLDSFKNEYEDIVDRALSANVGRILMPNIDLDSIKQVMSLHDLFPQTCLPMVGLHPCSVKENYQVILDDLLSYLDDKACIAVGEIGIDLYWDTSFEYEQEAAFRQQILWSKERALPIVIHSRASIDRTIDIVTELQDGSLKGVFHCFSESISEAKRIMDIGFYMGIGGVSTFKKNESFRKTLKEIPLRSLLLETDAPYLTPAPFRGKRNESSYIPYIAQVIADTKTIDIETIEVTTTENAVKLFSLNIEEET